MNENALKNKIQHFKIKVIDFITHTKHRLSGHNDLKEEERKIDQASKESFPASDPPGHISKSAEDKSLHT